MQTVNSRHLPAATDTSSDWRNHAACLHADDPELWFPIGDTPPAKTQTQKAQKICFACPVIQACGMFALTERIEYGIYGGMDEAERRRVLRQHRSKARYFTGIRATTTKPTAAP